MMSRDESSGGEILSPFRGIVGQSWPLSFLSRAARADRLSHTLIFHGPPFVGKERTALALASWWLCDKGTGCGTCSSCRQVAGYQHPDLQYVFPCPASWYADPSQIGEVIAQRANPENRLGEPLPDPSLTISIEAIRALSRVASRTSYCGRSRVFVVRHADRMREEAQNAFLKLLEEAPPDVHLLLLTTNIEGILPTVRSRAYVVRFSPLSRDDWIAVFRTHRSVEVEQASVLYRLSGGSLVRGAALLDEDHTVRMLPLELFRMTGPRQGSWVSSVFERLGPRVEREDVDHLIDFTLLWLRDALVWQCARDERLLVNLDAAAAITEVAERFDSEHLVEVIRDLDALRQATRLNLDPRLICHRIERLLISSLSTGGTR